MEKIREWFRKQLVNLKRNPQNIPLVMMAISTMYYALNMTSFSNTTTQCNLSLMGLINFVVTLASFLSLITFVQSFPKRQKPKYLMIGLTLFMLVLIIVMQIFYVQKIDFALYGQAVPLKDPKPFIFEAKTSAIVHSVLSGITIILVVLIPTFKKLLAKIDTSIKLEITEVEGNIDIEEE